MFLMKHLKTLKSIFLLVLPVYLQFLSIIKLKFPRTKLMLKIQTVLSKYNDALLLTVKNYQTLLQIKQYFAEF